MFPFDPTFDQLYVLDIEIIESNDETSELLFWHIRASPNEQMTKILIRDYSYKIT